MSRDEQETTDYLVGGLRLAGREEHETTDYLVGGLRLAGREEHEIVRGMSVQG